MFHLLVGAHRMRFLTNNIYFLLLCVMVDIISAVQFNLPLAPLPKKGFLKKNKSLAFYTGVLQMSCSFCEQLDDTDDYCLPKM